MGEIWKGGRKSKQTKKRHFTDILNTILHRDLDTKYKTTGKGKNKVMVITSSTPK